MKEQSSDSSFRTTFGILGVALVLAVALWLGMPNLRGRLAPKPTPLPPTATPYPTRTPRPTRTPTATLPPTATPLTASKFGLNNLAELDPPLAAPAEAAWVLNDDNSAQVDPPFDQPQWITSEQIGKQLDREIPEAYHATFGAASVTWQTDVQLPPGLVEIYVMDTVYSSAGPLDFTVRLGDTPLNPLLWQRQVEFQTSRFDPRQVEDRWRSIGTYLLDRAGRVSVSTAWGTRNEDSIVAVDRVVIVRLADATRPLLDLLPQAALRYVVDDSAARFERVSLSLDKNDAPAWGGQYKLLINPAEDVRVTWEMPELVQPGTFQVAVWVPPSSGQPPVTFHVLADGVELPPGVVSGLLTSGSAQGGWVSLGAFSTLRTMEKPVKLALQMDIAGGTTGEIPVDAAAFLRMP